MCIPQRIPPSQGPEKAEYAQTLNLEPSIDGETVCQRQSLILQALTGF